jgi:hypothetical protein
VSDPLGESPTTESHSQDRTASERRLSGELVAKPTKFGELIPATLATGFWILWLVQQGIVFGLETSWILLITLPLGGWALLMRLRFGPEQLLMTVGPWRRGVDLGALESITWKMTGGWRSRGTIFVRDRLGGRVPIYVGRFTRIQEWGPLLLDAAARSGATVDSRSRHLLEGTGAPR